MEAGKAESVCVQARSVFIRTSFVIAVFTGAAAFPTANSMSTVLTTGSAPQAFSTLPAITQ
jgi:hypothetical protein